MKKFILALMIFTLCSINTTANATTQVSYNNAGAISSIRCGAYKSVPVHNFGSNAAFTPRYAAMAGQRNRAIQREKAMTRAMANQYRHNGYNNNKNLSTNTAATSVGTNQISRFSKDYTIATPKSYNKNGVTYYN
jgi:hypothetical protein